MMNGVQVDVRERLRSGRPGASLDALRLAESNHRVAIELAAAVSALRLAADADEGSWRDRVRQAAVRLEAFADVHALLAHSGTGDVRLADVLERLCSGMVRAHLDQAKVSVHLHDCPLILAGPVAHRLACIVAELLGNTARHGTGALGARVDIMGSGTGEAIVLVVEERPVGPRRPGRSGTGLGRPLAEEMVRSLGGTVEFTAGPNSCRTEIRVPGRPAGSDRLRHPVGAA
ncbi:histidine kinase dimerization/phosphoacceptor domain -containing protein [Sphingomonas sp.]|uniref:histidine kinase dimerization/phosphoacceptor domain -containing protein n=1 Tax=Sphingomonas sp. TaxID=28214 RepID=UPI002DF61C0D|nr:histidine kinase dimerization/phosphoacceptor domain -containing protein [Sphingomonas sp.]